MKSRERKIHNIASWGQDPSKVVCVCARTRVLVSQLCLTFCDSMDCSSPGSSVRGILQASGVDCHSLFQNILLIQEWNPDLPHCSQILYHLSHQGSSKQGYGHHLNISSLIYTVYNLDVSLFRFYDHLAKIEIAFALSAKILAYLSFV